MNKYDNSKPSDHFGSHRQILCTGHWDFLDCSLTGPILLPLRRYGFLNFGYLRSYYSGWGRFYINANILGEFQSSRWKCGFHHLIRRGSFYHYWIFFYEFSKRVADLCKNKSSIFLAMLNIISWVDLSLVGIRKGRLMRSNLYRVFRINLPSFILMIGQPGRLPCIMFSISKKKTKGLRYAIFKISFSPKPIVHFENS